MSGRNSPAASTDSAQQLEVQAQEIQRLRAQLRAQTQTTRQAARADLRASYRATIAALTLGALLVGGAIGYWGFPREAAPESVPTAATDDGAHADRSATSFVEATPWPVRVYVSGAVVDAQVVALPAGSLIADAIEAVGGPTVDADLDGLNLAAPLEDGQHIWVPHLDVDPTEADASTPAPAEAGPIDINQASAEALTALPHIGEAKAAAIVAYRTANGAFETIEEIQEVPGIGSQTFESIAELITVGP